MFSNSSGHGTIYFTYKIKLYIFVPYKSLRLHCCGKQSIFHGRPATYFLLAHVS